MTTSSVASQKKTLVLSLIAGACGAGSWAALFSSYATFSIFPIIGLVLALYTLYESYASQRMVEGTSKLAAACFFIGVFGFSSFVRTEHPEIGTNFISLMIVLVLLCWVAYKQGLFSGKTATTAE
ncbi:YijD family membrane protein [Vibrio sp. SS-MA-C1-2]|uniref:YijD family membrane protein n=1 Tax=Vibrio sp. SS-MA-C1-2 TaxID=2908646 RepID=UPI001F172E79|nr:YijD family membrane protein [Vibrio sp. SS-MA-C1-2]UJF19458.1 YijD family membrane protein [Vibrio sp. SS-MA-C1-2]